jgi:5,6-dimethylbenzimidazole synthase
VRRFSCNSLPEKLLERLAGIACLAPSVGLSEPWRFVEVKSTPRREAIRKCFEQCNAAALESQSNEKSALYARLKLAGLDDAPCQFAVFADRATTRKGMGLVDLRCRRRSIFPQ